MNTTKFRVQVAAVLALVILVGWPRFRPLPQVSVWASRGTAPQLNLVEKDARVQAAGEDESAKRRRTVRQRGNTQSGSDSSSSQARDAEAMRRSAMLDDPPDLASAGARFNGIVGRARTLTNQPVPYGRVILRNTRTGLIEARTTADQEGRFSFLDVAQSGYVIELVGADGSVIASSELVSLSNGDLRQAVVRVAANSTVRAIFGNTAVAPTVQEAVNRAVQSATRGVNQSDECASPPCGN